ncbi:hypothetical protein ACHAXR_011300 [Thalassiosira sp. AJA248-18]
MKLLKDGFPEYGKVSPCGTYYISNNNDTTMSIAAAIGLDDWKQFNTVEFNRRFYNKLTGRMVFKQGTVLKIPTQLCSKWKLTKVIDNHVEELAAMATCSKCLKKEQPGDKDAMLLCDGCDLEIHVSCAGLTDVPKGDFLCDGCLEVLDARRKANKGNVLRDANGVRSLKAHLPPLPPMDGETRALAEKADDRFRSEIITRRDQALSRLQESQRVLEQSSKERIATLIQDVQTQTATVERETMTSNRAKRRIMSKYGLRDWSISDYGRSHIEYREEDGTTGTVYRERCSHTYWGETTFKKCPGWNRYYRKFQSLSQEFSEMPEKVTLQNAKDELSSLKQELQQAEKDEKERPTCDEDDRKQLLLGFAKLLSEPQLDFELKKEYQAREGFKTMFLGVVKLEEADCLVLNLLSEPTELVLSIPVEDVVSIDVDQKNEVGLEYYLFGTAELFNTERNDCLPMDFAPTSVRTAQRDLIAMLLRDQRNHALQVTSPAIPSSVALRGTQEENMRLGDIMKCFDLGELVRDCNYPILNMPTAETPKLLADNGLVLRNYQKTSLQWLLDKESNPTGMGSSGELWSRMRGLNSSGAQTWYFCDLTGTIVRNIFHYASDVGQVDAAPLRGDSFPSSAIIGSEMGLGKTVIALSLVVASPVSIQNKVLPRENIAKINHPAYLLPPSVTGSHSDKASLLSNGTLVIAPMTLCPQWQSEIQRFAPWMSVLTLHNEENNSAAEIASKDIIVMSTFLLANQNRGKTVDLLKKLRKIHFHRIFLDESHLNNSASRSADNSRDTNNTRLIKSGLAQLSSTHRYCVTGTPVGQSLADLYGQLRFLRVPQFCREDFFFQNIEKPYGEHNCSALTVMRSLLSRIVIRHSKEQNIMSLPARTVETLLLPFATEPEREIYEYIEKRNTQRFNELRSTSPATVMGKYTELNGLLVSARQACGHPGGVNLDELQNLNEKLEREKRQEQERMMIARGHLHELFEEKKGKKENMTRLEIFNQAVEKARSSAKTRMRQAVMELQSSEIEFIECPICLDATTENDLALTPCAHKFCAECILSCLDSTSTTREASGNCPECREKFNRSELTFLGDAVDANKQGTGLSDETNQKPKAKDTNVDINGFHLSTTDKLVAASGAAARRIAFSPLNEDEKRAQRANLHTLPPEFLTAWNVGYNQIGTKTARLLEEIKCMIKQDSTAKAVVFSQYLGTLNLASEELTRRGIKIARVDAMMKQHQRADNIISFTKDPSTKVLLLSMKAGAAGLNLVVANYCFLMDPTLNSAAEEQAIDRLHRIGQTRPVIVKRLIIKASVEERILENRRSLAADRPTASTLIDGTASMEEDEDAYKDDKKKRGRARQEDQRDLGEQTFQRLQLLEALFGCSATIKASKA